MAHQVPVGWPQEAKHKQLTTSSNAKTTVVAGVPGTRVLVKSLRVNAAANVYFDILQDLDGVETLLFNDVLINGGTTLTWTDDDGMFELSAGAALKVKTEGATITHYNVTYWQHP